MRAISRYRFFIAALLFSVVIHAIAMLFAPVLLQPGLNFDAPLQSRAAYLATMASFWRLGWFAWQLTALSDLLVSLALILYLREVFRRGGGRWAVWFAVLSLLATVLAVIPDQWGEFTFITSVVHDASEISQQRGDPADYIAQEATSLLLVGTYGNGGYTLMGLLWMLAAICSAGGLRRNWQFVTIGSVTWILFCVAGYFTWQATTFAVSEGVYRGFSGVFWCNAIAFPLLLAWMIMLAHVVGKGHYQRHPAADAELHFLRWPTEGPVSWWLAAAGNSRGLRDLLRASHRIVPVPVLASDIRDVVYLNWLVPAERVAAMLPPPLELDGFADRTFVSLLTYRHGHFGPRILGPLRRLMPSPCQSNWRLYVKPERPDTARDAIYFFKTSLDNSLFVIGSRLMSDGLPSQRPLQLTHQRDGARYNSLIDPGGGSAPDLRCTVQVDDQRELPPEMRAHFADWEQAVTYLIEQNRGVNVLAGQGRVRESRINIPIDVVSIKPARLIGLESRFLRETIAECECLAFVVPAVSFHALGEGWTAHLSEASEG